MNKVELEKEISGLENTVEQKKSELNQYIGALSFAKVILQKLEDEHNKGNEDAV